jgi:nitrogen fixation protein NifZ
MCLLWQTLCNSLIKRNRIVSLRVAVDESQSGFCKRYASEFVQRAIEPFQRLSETAPIYRCARMRQGLSQKSLRARLVGNPTKSLGQRQTEEEAMTNGVERLQPGDMVMCSQAIFNDGSFPDCADDALLVPAGQRGVVTNVGYVEAEPERQVFMVRFEMAGTNDLGPEIGCWVEDLTLAV